MQEVEHMRKHECTQERTQEKASAQGRASTQKRERVKKKKKEMR